jgi:hypothetical protein
MRLTLLEYESIVCLRGRISCVLRLMHYTGGNIIRLPSWENFPFPVLLARDNGPLDHRPLFVARMRMSACAVSACVVGMPCGKPL